MTIAEIKFDISSELLTHIQTPSSYAYQSFILSLYLDEEISFGKAAKLLNLTYDEFLAFLGRRNIPYFRETADEIEEALEALKKV